MAKTVTIDELHLTIRVPSDLPDTQAEEIRRALNGDDFMTRLRQTVRRQSGPFRNWPLPACR